MELLWTPPIFIPILQMRKKKAHAAGQGSARGWAPSDSIRWGMVIISYFATTLCSRFRSKKTRKRKTKNRLLPS